MNMKHFFRLLMAMGLWMFVFVPSFGQSFGFKGGLNISNTYDKPDKGGNPDFKNSSGFHLGIITDIPFSDKISLETDLYVTTKGSKREEKRYNDLPSLKGHLQLYYIEIPIALKIILSKTQTQTKPYLSFGPYVGFGLSGKVTVVNKTQSIHFGSAYDEDFRDLDVGLTFGGGIQVKGFLVGINYDLGLINMLSHDDMNAKIYNRTFRLSVGYIFPNKRKHTKGSDNAPNNNDVNSWWK